MDVEPGAALRRPLGPDSTGGLPEAVRAAAADPIAAAPWLAARMREVAAGDARALAELVQALGPRLLRAARGVTFDEADAEEAVNDTWRQVWRHAGSYDPARAPVHGWLLAIVHRQAIDIVRRRDARARHEGTAEQLADPAVEEIDPARGMEARQGVSALRRALQRLTTRRRLVVRLAMVEQHSHSEIARQTGMPLGTVKTRVREALRALRSMLGG